MSRRVLDLMAGTLTHQGHENLCVEAVAVISSIVLVGILRKHGKQRETVIINQNR